MDKKKEKIKKEFKDKTHEVLNQSESGAPASGHAVRDMFSTDEIFHRVTATADEEFSRSNRLLFLSGLAAGLSISLSFLAQSAISASIPGKVGDLAGSLFYPTGFLLIVLGRYQLFTENTLTPVTLVLTRLASFPRLFKVWGIVLLANILGAGAGSYLFAHTGIFDPDTREAAHELARHALEMNWDDSFFKGIIAGWLVASLVWLNHAARDSVTRFFNVFLIMFVVSATDLAHCIVGSCEVLYLVFLGDASINEFLFHFLIPVVLGNTVGGVLLVAILNYSQTKNTRFPDRDCGQLELNWKEWLLGSHDGIQHALKNGKKENGTNAKVKLTPSVNAEDRILGKTSAPVVLVQYGDYECPTSKKIYEIVQDILNLTDLEVAYVYRHLPLSQRHKHAKRAAMAAEAARNQHKFWKMHEHLFDSMDHLEDKDLINLAELIELDTNRFKKDLESDEIDKRLSEHRTSGIKSGIRNTANLFINEVYYNGKLEFEPLLETIKKISSAKKEVPENSN